MLQANEDKIQVPSWRDSKKLIFVLISSGLICLFPAIEAPAQTGDQSFETDTEGFTDDDIDTEFANPKVEPDVTNQPPEQCEKARQNGISRSADENCALFSAHYAFSAGNS